MYTQFSTLPPTAYEAYLEFLAEYHSLCRRFNRDVNAQADYVHTVACLGTVKGSPVDISTIATMLDMPRSSVQHIVRRLELVGMVTVGRETPTRTIVTGVPPPEGFIKKRDALILRFYERAYAAFISGQGSISAA